MSTSDDLRQIFNKFDINNDGKISTSEISAMIRSLGQKVSDEEIKLMMTEADLNGDGFISFDEFTKLNLKNKKNAEEIELELRDAFGVFDKDGNGLISAEELCNVLRGLGQICSVDDCRNMIRAVDANGDGFVDFDEFKVMMDGNGMTSDGNVSACGVGKRST